MSADYFLLDDRRVAFRPGQTIMDAAMAAGIYIPHLCHQPGFTPQGSCKLCTVDVDGRPASACTTPAREGIVVENDTAALNDDRRTLLELLFVEGNHICPSCERSGDCQLQALAYHLGLVQYRFEHFYPRRGIDASHPDFILDRDRCILCELCVRASRDIDGKNVFGIGQRGIASRLLVNAGSDRLGDTDLDLADVAARVCPVGALLPRRRAFEVPIGSRTYDLKPISVVALEGAQAAKERDDG